jgi:hypothetical protein
MALLNEQNNSHALPLVKQLLTIFDTFVEDLNDLVRQHHDNSRNMDTDESRNKDFDQTLKLSSSYVGVLKSAVPHLTISVFQEHPKILPIEQQRFWRPTSERTMNELVQALDATMMKHPLLSSLHRNPILLHFVNNRRGNDCWFCRNRS